MTDEAQVGALYDGAIERYGRIDVAVHNAGLGGTVPLVEMTDEQWSTVLDITLDRHVPLHPGRPAPAAAPAERASSSTTPRSSAGGPSPARPTTPRPRPGVMALTRCAAAEAAPSGVRVNAVSPSLAEHPFLNRAIPDEDLAVLRRRELFGRGAETWEVANVIVFLASDYSSYMTGEVISVSSQHP